MAARVACGVTSRGVSPVPPVVMMRSCAPAPSTMATSIWRRSSGTRPRSTRNPRAARRSPTCAPEVSSRTPAAAPSLAVMTRADLTCGSAIESALALVLRPHATGRARTGTGLRMCRGRGGWRVVADPRPALAARLRDEADALDLDAALDALDHVVDGQGGHRRRCHRLHLDAGLARGRGFGADA